MTSSRLILIFLGFIFLIIVILSSSRISTALRSRFGKLLPPLTPTVEEASLTPTPTVLETLTPTPTVVYGRGTNGTVNKGGTASPKTIPAAGPADTVWLLLAGSFFAGVTLKKIAGKRG